MQFRDGVPRNFHHTILRINSSRMIQKLPSLIILVNRGVGIVELCGSRLNPSPCLMVFQVLPGLKSKEDDVKFLGFAKNDGDRRSGASRSSKMFPQVPIEFRVSSGKQDSWLIIPLGLRTLEG